MNQILNVIFMTLTGTVQGIALDYMLNTNEQRSRRWMRIIYWTFLAILPSVLNVIKSYGTLSLILRNSIHWMLAFGAIFLFYRDPFWRRLLAVTLVFIGTMSAELSLLLVVQFTDIRLDQIMDKSSDISTVITGFGMLISCICIFFIAVTWRKLFRKGKTSKYFGIYLLFLINHATVYWFLEQEVWSQNLTLENGFSGLTSTICAIALMAVIFSQAEKESLEANVAEEMKKKELEQISVRELEKSRLEILKITNNSNQNLQRVQIMMKNNQFYEAEKELNNLSEQIEATKEYPYCDIPIVNVILSQKGEICKEKAITFLVNMRITNLFSIKQMDLCSIFSNLLDNAIRASEQLRKANEYAEIQLNAAVVGEYLVIKGVNRINKIPGNTPEGTGYGMKILKDIAQKYDGTLQNEFSEHEYKAQITLKIK